MTTLTTTPALARVVSPILRVGIVGRGNIADNHFQALTALPHVEVVGVADVDRARARSFAGERGIPRAVTSLADLLELGLDAVTVCTPHPSHEDVVTAAARAGVHVLAV
jgi:UDP-N-acetyl-2-amino-2-deoxyglucuronate dehydrogenase